MNRPKDAEYEWKAAKSSGGATFSYNQHRYYKFKDNEWYSWSVMFQQWNKSRNDSVWFAEQIIQGYFVEVK